MSAPLVTIVIPNWNTGQLLRVCLASVVRFTEVPHRIVVVDNASGDASRETAEGAAAKGLITLVRRDDAKNEGAADHGAALDAGLAATETPLLMTLDSDAWARRPGWLAAFVEALGDASHAGARKFPSGRVKQAWDWLRRKELGPESRYIRPCHALYRVDLLRDHQLSFGPWRGPEGRWRTCGEHLHEQLLELEHPGVFMPHAQVEALVGHLRHATFVLNAEQFPTLRAKTRRKGEAQIERLLASEGRRILEGSPVP